MKVKSLEVVVLEHDIPARGLRKGDLGAIVEVVAEGQFLIEFVAASGRSQALIPLGPADVRPVNDKDLLSVRPVA